MTIKCRKCKGRVLIERALSNDTHLELYCILCGKIWIFKYPEGQTGFVKWLWQKEKAYQKKILMGK